MRARPGAAAWHGVQARDTEAFEHAQHHVVAAQDERGDLRDGMALVGQQDDLVAQARLGVGGGMVAVLRLRQRRRVEGSEGERCRHG